jgi:hypothetical protein
VADLWREHGLKPHRQDTFKLSRGPDYAEKVADIVGLYLSPPAAAVMPCVDEKSKVQALDRTRHFTPEVREWLAGNPKHHLPSHTGRGVVD